MPFGLRAAISGDLAGEGQGDRALGAADSVKLGCVNARPDLVPPCLCLEACSTKWANTEMIYEQLKANVAELERLEINRGFKFVYENANSRSAGDVFLDAPDFRIKIVCESGWAYTEISPFAEDRWIPASSVFVYLGKDVSSGYPYGRAPLPVQLAEVDSLYESISEITKSSEAICLVEQLTKRRLEDFIARLRAPNRGPVE